MITLLAVVSGVKLRVMKTLGSADDKEEILRRMENVRPDSRRLWGKMSAHQMICHLSDGFRMYLGEKRLDEAGISSRGSSPAAVRVLRAARQIFLDTDHW